MAAVELKSDIALGETITKSEDLTADSERKIELYKFKTSDVIFCIFSVGTFVADIVTDGIVVMEYFSNGYTAWAYFTLGLMLVPAGIIQFFSLRWYHFDDSLSTSHWTLHLLLMGVIHRCLVLLCAAVDSMIRGRSTKDKDWVHRRQSDICMLHLFKSFMEAAPQLLLQLYIMAVLQHMLFWTGILAATSLCSLIWAVAAYARAVRKIHLGKYKVTWSALALQACWRSGMLTSRVASLVLAAICTREWFFLLIGIHWLCMTIWVVFQNTDFCPTAWEERIYNCIIGIIYCFDFFNLCEGRSRYRILAFYLIMVTQNMVFLIVYIVYFESIVQSDLLTISTIMVVGGTLIGLTSMLLYYGKFHPTGNIKFCENVKMDLEIATERRTIDRTETLKPLKHRWHSSAVSLPHSTELSQGTTLSEDVTADKKSLLTNIVQNTEFMEEGIVNSNYDIINEIKTTIQVLEGHVNSNDSSIRDVQNSSSTIQNAENKILHSQKSSDINSSYGNFCMSNAEVIVEDDYVECDNIETLRRQKRRGIYLPVELGLQMDEPKSEDFNASSRSKKRRGICSSAQLDLELVIDEDNCVEKSSKFERHRPTVPAASEIELKLNRFEVNNSLKTDVSIETGDNFSESIKDRERLRSPTILDSEKIYETTSEEISQKEETMSHVTSVHDYENVCSLGIARPPWCIRSWKGYTDIETYIHDDSIVRDRRRDTLTSSATGTTFSSEFSDPTCTSPASRRALKQSRQDDYLDTLIYDLADWESNVASNEELSTPALSDIDEQETSLFVAKPVVIDDKGGMFALDTILEEREELTGNSDTGIDLKGVKNRTVSTLVATIDEIRKCTIENSPTHIYGKTEARWEDLQSKILIKKANLTKVLFTNDFNDLAVYSENSSGLLDRLPAFSKSDNEIKAIREITKCRTTGSIGKTPIINDVLSTSPGLGLKAELKKYHNIKEDFNASDLEEHNVYVEMRSLVPEKSDEMRKLLIDATLPSLLRTDTLPLEIKECRNSSSTNRDFERHSEESVLTRLPLETCEINLPICVSSPRVDNSLKIENVDDSTLRSFEPVSSLVSSKMTSQLSNISCSPTTYVSYEKRKRIVNRPRRKFSLLRERFEPKSERLVYTVTPQNAITVNQSNLNTLDEQVSIILNNKSHAVDFAVTYDKENVTPAVTSRISHWNSFIREQNCTNVEQYHSKDVSSNNDESDVKKKRSIFLKQVLSPPKFQSWSKKRTFSPNAKIISKAL